MSNKVAHFSLLVAAAIALFGAGIHWIAPALGPDWYAFLHAPDAAVASARNGTAFGPLGAIVIGALMFACTLFALSGRGDIGYLPFTRAALAVISFICLVRGLIIIPYIIILPSVSPFVLVASVIWFVAGVGFFVGLVGTWSDLSQKASRVYSVGGS
jgi:hypothetical protein